MIRRASSVGGGSSSSKAAALLTRGAYTVYVNANAAKSGKSVSPKVRQKGENAAGGFFQHSLLEFPIHGHGNLFQFSHQVFEAMGFEGFFSITQSTFRIGMDFNE